MRRRDMLKMLASVPLALVASGRAVPAFAGSTIVNNGGSYSSTYTAATNAAWTGWTNSGGVGYSYVYLYAGPATSTAWLASIPVNQAVQVVAYAPGEVLAPPNPLWYNVVAPQGTGWVYSGLISYVEPVLKTAAEVAPPPGPIPPPIGSGLSIGISLSRQHLWAYSGGTSIFDVDVTTGSPDKPTPAGVFTVFQKIPNFKFISPFPPSSPFWYPDSPTHFAMAFLDGGYYIHDAPWRPYYGPGTDLPHLDPDGTIRAGSHGCVNTQLATIQFLANWTQIGTPVNIIA